MNNKLNISVKLTTPNNPGKARNKKNTGYWTPLAYVTACISLKDGTVIIEELRGLFGMSEPDSTRIARPIVSFNSNGDQYNNTIKLPETIQSILKFETIKAYGDGNITTINYDEKDASNAGIEVDEYTKVMEKMFQKAKNSESKNNIKTEDKNINKILTEDIQ